MSDAQNLIQNFIHEELISRLGYIQIKPKNVLLIGDFSPIEIKKISEIYSKSKIKSLSVTQFQNQTQNQTQDQDSLNQKEFFDVVLALNLLPERKPENSVFETFFENLTSGGMLLFTTLGPQQSTPEIEYPDMHDIGDLLLHLNFENPVMDTEFFHQQEVVFGHAWKPKTPKQKKDADGSIRVSIENLLKSLKLKN